MPGGKEAIMAAKKNQEMTLTERGQKAAALFLEKRGFEIVEAGPEKAEEFFPVVAKDDDELVFCGVTVRDSDSDGLPTVGEEKDRRKLYESAAAEWLGRHQDAFGDDSLAIRFDEIAILVIGENRALLRHHINAFGIG